MNIQYSTIIKFFANIRINEREILRKRAKNKVYFNFLQRMLPKLVKKQISSLVEYFSQQHCGWAMFATEEALVSPRSAARRPYKVYLL